MTAAEIYESIAAGSLLVIGARCYIYLRWLR